MQIAISQILPIGQIGMTRLEIPVYTCGTGSPVLGITAYLHGDEASGIYVISRIIDVLRSLPDLSGTIHLIPIANPAAQLVGTRLSPTDQQDINRLRQGDRQGTITERSAFQVFQVLRQCDLVLNFHTFEMVSPITAVFMNAGSQAVRNTTIEAIRAFSPRVVWVTDAGENHNSLYQSTLDVALAETGVANFSIETADIVFLSDRQIEACVTGVCRVAKHLGMLRSESESLVEPQILWKRKVLVAEIAGLWEPEVALQQHVEPETKIGRLTDLKTFKHQDIFAQSSGILFQYRHRQPVMTGSSLVSLAIPLDQIDLLRGLKPS